MESHRTRNGAKASAKTMTVMFVGEYGVGKTQLISRIRDNRFTDYYKPSINPSYKDLECSDFTLHLIDIPGYIENIYDDKTMRYPDIVVFVADNSRTNTVNAIEEWYSRLTQAADKLTCPYYIIYNKTDLGKHHSESDRVTDIKQHATQAFHCSVKKDDGIEPFKAALIATAQKLSRQGNEVLALPPHRFNDNQTVTAAIQKILDALNSNYQYSYSKTSNPSKKTFYLDRIALLKQFKQHLTVTGPTQQFFRDCLNPHYGHDQDYHASKQPNPLHKKRYPPVRTKFYSAMSRANDLLFKANYLQDSDASVDMPALQAIADKYQKVVSEDTPPVKTQGI